MQTQKPGDTQNSETEAQSRQIRETKRVDAGKMCNGELEQPGLMEMAQAAGHVWVRLKFKREEEVVRRPKSLKILA